MKRFKSRLVRLGKIVSVFVSFYWSAFIQLKNNEDNSVVQKRAVLLRQSFEKLGSVFIKFGQFLSLRPDLIPVQYCKELFYLLERVPPFPKEQVVQTIQDEFGMVPGAVFKSFDTTPIAAASFGQVHVAFLKTGQKVAVKIQRPHIEQLVKQDIALLKILTIIGDIFWLGPNKLTPSIAEFEQWTLEELDYRKEAERTEMFYERSKNKRDDIVVPRIHQKQCSSKIITTDFVQGVTLSAILLAIRNNDKHLLTKVKALGFSRKHIAERLLKNSLRQIYLDGLFHADPHPANILFIADATLGYIDFGIVEQLDKQTRLTCLRYTRSVFFGDTENSFNALMKLMDISAVTDVQNFKREHDAIIKETLADFKRGKTTGNPHVIGKILFAKLRLLQKYKAVLPINTLRYFRALSTLEGIILELDPGMKLEDLARKFRNVSIVNVIKELPVAFSPEKAEHAMMGLLNALEKELSSS